MITSSIQVRKRAAYAILGNKCSRCGFEDVRALQIDHVNGNAKQDEWMTKPPLHNKEYCCYAYTVG